MLVLAANRHLYIWPNWQLHSMTASTGKFRIWLSFATVKAGKREILWIVWNKEAQSADRQRAAAGIDNTGSTNTHLKYTTKMGTLAQLSKPVVHTASQNAPKKRNTSSMPQSKTESVQTVGLKISLSCKYRHFLDDDDQAKKACQPVPSWVVPMFQWDSSDQASSASFLSEMILHPKNQIDWRTVCLPTFFKFVRHSH